MLHHKSRENRQKNHFTLIVLFASAFLILTQACKNIRHQWDEETAADPRVKVIADSAQDAKKHLEQFVLSNNDSLYADLMVCKYYKEGGEWLWVRTDTSFFQKAIDLAGFLERSTEDMGFSANAFFTDSIRHSIDYFRNLNLDSTHTSISQAMAELELALSKAFLRYALGQRYGFMNPHKVLNKLDTRKEGGFRIVYDISLEQPSYEIATAALKHCTDKQPEVFLAECESKHPVYTQLKEYLRNDTTPHGRQRIMCNMERLRWRPQHPIGYNQPQVFVNIPAQHLWVIGQDTIFDMHICCGAWKTKTPLLTSNIRLIQLNPEWNIPGSILRDEVSQHAGDSVYFARNHYFIVKRSSGDTISAKDVTQAQLKSGAYRVAQHSGPSNSLGRIIFRFNNQFDVYLHDTNNRNAFNYERRTISHGCVRIQRPFDLLAFLLPDAEEWTMDRIRLSIDKPPETERGKNYLKEHAHEDTPIRLINSINVNPQFPVVIDYYTIYPNPETGEMETWPDRYEYDIQIAKHIKPYTN